MSERKRTSKVILQGFTPIRTDLIEIGDLNKFKFDISLCHAWDNFTSYQEAFLWRGLQEEVILKSRSHRGSQWYTKFKT